jgi:flagellar basal-body rod protein FlgF
MDGIAWAASAMVAARTRLEIATENLANVSSDAFRRILARGSLTPSGVRVRGYAAPGRGALRRTGRTLDLAIVGDGAFTVRDPAGRTTDTRAGSFARRRDGALCDPLGRVLLAGGRVLTVPEDARFDERGNVFAGSSGALLARIPLPPGSSVYSGFLESASVNAISEMIDVLRAERSFETAQKVVSAIDRVREKASSDVARVT